MKILRRFCSVFVLLAAPLALLGVGGKVTRSPAKSYRAYVGTYTARTNSKGIYEFDFDPATGKMSVVQVAAETKDPSWVAVHPNGKYLYSVNETGKASTVSAFSIDPKNGNLSPLNQLPSLGEDPCYLSFDKTGKFLFVANYTSGNVAVFPILADGKLGEHTGLVKNEGTLGPNKERQEGPHAHWIEPSENNTSVYVADLGLDRLFEYQFDAAKGTLSKAPTHSDWAPSGTLDPSVKLVPGTGPRHAIFAKGGARMYVLGELQSTVTGFHMVGTDLFTPTSFQRISALPEGLSGRNDAAEIAMHPSGNFLYTSNRGKDTVAIFKIDRRTGRLQRIADVSTGGKEPRNFAIDPTGHFLLAENQLSDTIVEFRIDPATGRLTPTGETLQVPSPVCITFLPAE
jgi:6-phosphogluconolactonase